MAITRTSIGIGRVSPSQVDLALLQHAQQFRLQAQRQLADFVQQQCSAVRYLKFSRLRRDPAPVKAPRTWPNNSLSSRLSGNAEQFTATNGLDARELARE